MHSYKVVRETWLTRKIDGRAVAIASLVSLFVLFSGLVYWNGTWQADQWMAATYAQVFGKHEYWRLWTTFLVHADGKHLLSNSLLFFILGTFLYGYFGRMAFPILPFLFGGVTNWFVVHKMREDVPLVGVSGVVFWMGGFWLVLYLMIDRRRTWVQRCLRATGVGLGLFFPAEAFDPSISYSSHLYGFESGILVGFLYYFWNRKQFRAAEVIEEVIEEDDLVTQEPTN